MSQGMEGGLPSRECTVGRERALPQAVAHPAGPCAKRGQSQCQLVSLHEVRGSGQFRSATSASTQGAERLPRVLLQYQGQALFSKLLYCQESYSHICHLAPFVFLFQQPELKEGKTRGPVNGSVWDPNPVSASASWNSGAARG